MAMITVLEMVQSQRLPLGDKKKKDSICYFEADSTNLFFYYPTILFNGCKQFSVTEFKYYKFRNR